MSKHCECSCFSGKIRPRFFGIVLLLLVVFVSLWGVELINAGTSGHTQRAKDLWQRIQSDRYRDTWSLFPGKGKLYKGTEPHGMLLTTYVNEVAEKGLRSKVKVLPEGSILVKENYKPDKTLAAITVMEKTGPGKDDWFWVKYMPDGSVAVKEMEKYGKRMKMPVAGGKKTMCASCHAASISGVHNVMTPLED